MTAMQFFECSTRQLTFFVSAYAHVHDDALDVIGGRSQSTRPTSISNKFYGLLGIYNTKQRYEFRSETRKFYEARCPLQFSDELASRAPNFVQRVMREPRESRCPAKVAWDRSLFLHSRGWLAE
jgi:hypothetical protein